MKYYVAFSFLCFNLTLHAEESKNLFITCKIENISYLINMNSETTQIQIESDVFLKKSRRVLNQMTAYNKRYLVFSKHIFEQNQIYLFKISSVKEFDEVISTTASLMILNLENDQISYKSGVCEMGFKKGSL